MEARIRKLILTVGPAAIRGGVVFSLPLILTQAEANKASYEYAISYILTLAFSSSIGQLLLVSIEKNKEQLKSAYWAIVSVIGLLLLLLDEAGISTKYIFVIFVSFHVYFLYRTESYLLAKPMSNLFYIEGLTVLCIAILLTTSSKIPSLIMMMMCFINTLLVFNKSTILGAVKESKRIFILGLTTVLSGSVPYIIAIQVENKSSPDDFVVILQCVTVCAAAAIAARYFATDLLMARKMSEIIIQIKKLKRNLYIICSLMSLVPFLLFVFNKLFFSQYSLDKETLIITVLLSVQIGLTVLTLPHSILANIACQELSALKINIIYFIFFIFFILVLNSLSSISLAVTVVGISVCRLYACERASKQLIENLKNNYEYN